MTPDSVTVLGAGSFGTALAALLARNGARTRLWGRDAGALAQMDRGGENTRYLPGITLPETLRTEVELPAALHGADQVLIAVPCAAFDHMVEAVAAHAPDAAVIWACKGLDPEGDLLDRAARPLLGERARLAVLSGPTFAAEVARDLPTAMTLAADSLGTARRLAARFHGGRCRVYASDDLTGVQLAGAVKNVYAIAAGISDALGFGANARAALITRALAELGRLGVAMGGRPETLTGLSGLGDLILTCTDDQSRNRRFGLAIGAGQGVEAAIAAIGQAVEGAHTARRAQALGQRAGVELPIVDQVVAVLDGERQPLDAVGALLAREARAEVG